MSLHEIIILITAFIVSGLLFFAYKYDFKNELKQLNKQKNI